MLCSSWGDEGDSSPLSLVEGLGCANPGFVRFSRCEDAEVARVWLEDTRGGAVSSSSFPRSRILEDFRFFVLFDSLAALGAGCVSRRGMDVCGKNRRYMLIKSPVGSVWGEEFLSFPLQRFLA